MGRSSVLVHWKPNIEFNMRFMKGISGLLLVGENRVLGWLGSDGKELLLEPEGTPNSDHYRTLDGGGR